MSLDRLKGGQEEKPRLAKISATI